MGIKCFYFGSQIIAVVIFRIFWFLKITNVTASISIAPKNAQFIDDHGLWMMRTEIKPEKLKRIENFKPQSYPRDSRMPIRFCTLQSKD